MTVQPQIINLNYLIDPTFTKVNRLFVCHLQEMLNEIVEIIFHIIMYQTLK